MIDASEVQIRLSQMGLYNGKIDGYIGPLTRIAIKLIQRAFGIQESGEVCDETIEAINGGGQIPPPPPPVKTVSKQKWPSHSGVMDFYGHPGQNQVTLLLPFPMRIAWEPNKTIRQFSVHKKVHDSALRVFNKISQIYSPKERTELGIDIWGGCLNVRKMRGGNSLSMHSWGIAIDFDPSRNQLRWGRDQARLASADAIPFWEAWEEEGWYSLGRRENRDWMHVEATAGRH